MGERQLAVANRPNIFQMLLVAICDYNPPTLQIDRQTTVMLIA